MVTEIRKAAVAEIRDSGVAAVEVVWVLVVEVRVSSSSSRGSMGTSGGVRAAVEVV